MVLSAGERLGAYEILAPIGAGGMGEVYRARDTKLGREVAIKVLPEEFSRDVEKLARFQREAHLLASVNHPNIATLYGFEESDSQHFLVMELVEGETLAERIVRGPIPLDEALPLFTHVAEGLEAAHDKGVVHRDLKPANIKITPDHRPKILDFGLAKALAGDVAQDLSQSPTLTRDATGTGVLLGTAPYMSPEQARGKLVDKKADIWAFGCCLYEALTGKAVFLGQTVSDTIAVILKNEPDWEALPATTPTIVRSLLRRCLQKDAGRRLHDIADARIEIEEASAAPDKTDAVVSAHAVQRRTAWVLAIVLLSVVGVAGWLRRPSVSEAPRPVSRFQIGVRPADKLGIPVALARQLGTSHLRLSRTTMALSPDGTRFVYVGADGDSSRLYLRPLDQYEASPLPGTERGLAPFFSPDAEWVGFWADGKLRKVPVRGGPSVELCDAGIPWGASWGATGRIVYSNGRGLLEVPDIGGTPKSLTSRDADIGELRHLLPQILPGGKGVLFTVTRVGGWDNARIELLRLATGERSVLIDNGADARYVPSGHLVYARSATLMAAPFDVALLEITGGSVGILDGVTQAINTFHSMAETGAAQFSFSESGSLVYIPGSIRPDPRNALVWVDRAGRSEDVNLTPRRLSYPRISPDGKRVAFNAVSEGNNDIWLYELSRGTLTRLTSEESAEDHPLWTPDGKRITFVSNESGIGQVYWMAWDGTASAERLTTTQKWSGPASWTPDGKVLAFHSAGDIWTFPLDGKPEPFVQSPFRKWWTVFSPDGRHLAYASDESGRWEVYVQPYPGPGPRVQVSNDGGRAPVWANGGRELFYRGLADAEGTKAMMAVDIAKAASGFRAGIPRLLFRNGYGAAFPVRNYDVTSDGARFLMVRVEMPRLENVTELHVVLNWFQELERLVPTNN